MPKLAMARKEKRVADQADEMTYISPTIDAAEANRLIAEEREKIRKESDRLRKEGEVRLTDLQLAALATYVGKGGRSHAYGVYMQTIRDGQQWTEQAVRQAVDRLRTLGLLRELPDGDESAPARIELEVVDMEFARRVIHSERQRRANFLARIESSMEDRRSVM